MLSSSPLQESGKCQVEESHGTFGDAGSVSARYRSCKGLVPLVLHLLGMSRVTADTDVRFAFNPHSRVSDFLDVVKTESKSKCEVLGNYLSERLSSNLMVSNSNSSDEIARMITRSEAPPIR